MFTSPIIFVSATVLTILDDALFKVTRNIILRQQNMLCTTVVPMFLLSRNSDRIKLLVFLLHWLVLNLTNEKDEAI